jgi:CYTH domain-containing protein
MFLLAQDEWRRFATFPVRRECYIIALKKENDNSMMRMRREREAMTASGKRVAPMQAADL